MPLGRRNNQSPAIRSHRGAISWIAPASVSTFIPLRAVVVEGWLGYVGCARRICSVTDNEDVPACKGCDVSLCAVKGSRFESGRQRSGPPPIAVDRGSRPIRLRRTFEAPCDGVAVSATQLRRKRVPVLTELVDRPKLVQRRHHHAGYRHGQSPEGSNSVRGSLLLFEQRPSRVLGGLWPNRSPADLNHASTASRAKA